MINKEDKIKIVKISKKYGISRVFLFGSSLNDSTEANDIDIAIEGLRGANFFKFYGELIFSLSKPVDVVDLTNKSKITDIIYSEGLRLYG